MSKYQYRFFSTFCLSICRTWSNWSPLSAAVSSGGTGLTWQLVPQMINLIFICFVSFENIVQSPFPSEASVMYPYWGEILSLGTVLYPYTAERRDVLENTLPEVQEISQGWGFCTPRPERLPEGEARGQSRGPRGVYFPIHPSSRQCTDTI